MKISLNWLKELCNLPNLPATEIGEKITLHTAELEEVIELNTNFEKVFAGKLLSTVPHPNSDKLMVGQFDLGKQGTKQIVYGAAFPLETNKVYPIAIDGAVLATGQVIKDTEIKGQASQGMACNNPELGMKNDGLLELYESDIGKSLPELCGEFGDTLFDIDNKSLTHRPDLMGHRGFAREYGTIFGVERDRADLSMNAGNTPLAIEIKSPYCRRFMAAKVDQVTVQTSSLRDMIRLENLGVRSISNIVDITNLVMLEWGQPMHAFDGDKVQGTIIIRQAKPGEKLLALDENEYELTTDDIVIADEAKVLSIAGIMGGLESAVTSETKSIIFESANFDPAVVRKTSARLGLRSESSMRFEKSLDPENCANGIHRALELVKNICPNSHISSGITDEYPTKPQCPTIELSCEQVRSLGGIGISDQAIIDILTGLEFTVEIQSTGELAVTVPSFRATKDIHIPEDLIEEVVRINGFDAIPEKLPNLPLTPPTQNKLRQLEWRIRDILATNDLLEVYHTAFVSPQDHELIENTDHVQSINATNAESQYLRQTLLSNFLRHLETELRKHKSVQFFEIGKVYRLPTTETKMLGIVSAALPGDAKEVFFELKTKLEKLMAQLNLSPVFMPTENPNSLQHPHMSADITVEEENIGSIFVVFPSKNETKKSAVAYAELNLETLLPHTDQTIFYHKLSEYPVSGRDLSIVLDHKALIGDIQTTAKASAQFLTHIELFDEYYDTDKFGEDQKNLAFHLSFQSENHTLSHEEIEADYEQITKTLKQEYQAELRVDFDNKNN